MTYIVTDNCIACKYTDCVEVCPVDCFYEGENMLVIHPDECIDCGVCEPECPVEAIYRVILSDGERSDVEDAYVRHVAGLLHVDDIARAEARKRAEVRINGAG